MRKPDLEWMTLAIKADFGIITADRNDRTRGLAAQEFKLMGARVMLLGSFWDHLSIWSKAKWMVSRWEHIAGTLDEMPSGSCVLIGATGRVTEV